MRSLDIRRYRRRSEAPMPIEFRTVPGREYRLPAITCDIGGVATQTRSSRATAVAQIRRAASAGVTAFDLAHGQSPDALAALVGEALPEATEELVLIVGPPPAGRSLAGVRSAPGPSTSPREPESVLNALLESLGRRDGTPRVLVEWNESTADPFDASVESMLRRRVVQGEILDYAVPPVSNRAASRDGSQTPSGLETVRLSLLDTAVLEHGSGMAATSTGWVAHDVLAGGRLDGSALGETAYRTPTPSVPKGIRALRAAFDPVLSLGYLTERRDRTLAQAALQFALAWPRVVTVVVPLPEPSRMAEILEYSRARPLSPEELARATAGPTDRY